MPGPPSDHDRVQSAFVRALDVPVAGREAFVRRVLLDRPELAARVLGLLEGAGAPPVEGLHVDVESAAWDEPLLRLERLGPYRLLGLIGRGGMAVVLHAEHEETKREVALKLLPLGSGSRALRERLVRESDVLRSLKHPNIARWRDGGVLETPEGSRPFVAMDFVQGIGLLEWVRREEPSATRRLFVLEQVARAVGHAHARGVVHRDLKPNNVLVDRSDRVVVLDFGVAKVLCDAGFEETLTCVGQIVGTLRFMSPEQARGDQEAVGAATDVHALGLLIHEVMTGSPPYAVPSTIVEALPAIARAEIAPPAIEDATLRRALTRIGEATLARDPAERLADAHLLADDLAAAREGREVPRRVGRWRRAWKRVRRPAASVAVLAAVAFAATFLPTGRGDRPLDPDTTMQTVGTVLDEVTTVLHRSERTEASVQRAIEDLLEARALLNAIPPGPATPEWQRFLHWRLGEAYYFLGALRRDPAALSQALGAWDKASHIDPSRAGLAALDRGSPLWRDIVGITVSRTLSGCGLAHAALAEYRDPDQEWRASSNARAHALRRLQAERARATTGFRTLEPTPGDRIQGLARNEYGESLMMLAFMRSDVSLLDRAFEQFAMVDSTDMLATIPAAEGSFRTNVGRAHTIRALLEDDPSSLDDATRWLEASLELRGAADRLDPHVESHVALARVEKLRAKFASDPAEAFDWMRRVLGRVEWIEQAHGDLIHPHDRGLLAEEVACSAIQVALHGDAKGLDVARHWLDRADAHLSRAERPVAYVRLLLKRARLERACVEIRACDREEGFAAAESLFALAESVLPREQLPWVHHRIDTERARWEILPEILARD